MAERPVIFSGPMVRALLAGRKTMTRRLATSPLRKCEPGDRLWVRETWKPHSLYAGMKPRDVPESNVFYAADEKYAPSNTPWIPSIHMPRWASRITLEVTAVKVEKLHDISEEDAIAEGISWSDDYEGYHTEDSANFHARDPTRSFEKVWWQLHPSGSIGAWEANPEVVAISFRRVEVR